jgi:hydroxyacylglutathione hydrolase
MIKSAMLTLHNWPVGPLQENTYFLYASGAQEGILIDPGDEAGRLETLIRATGVKPALILATHGHFDHVGAIHALAKAFGAKVGLNPADQPLMEELEDTAAFYGMQPTKAPAVDLALADGQHLEAGGLILKVLATPGHTLGSVCFYHAPTGHLFSGDTLFQGSVGRSDTGGGNHEQLLQSIARQLLPLPGATLVFPGHGDSTTLDIEKKTNRFLVGLGA